MLCKPHMSIGQFAQTLIGVPSDHALYRITRAPLCIVFVLVISCSGRMKSDVDDHPTDKLLFVDGSYLIIDISGGPDADHYSSRIVDSVPSDLLTNDAYKTDKIVLRWIPAGTFMMGSPEDEIGRDWNAPYEEDRLEINIQRGFYIGVFEVTQRQWLNVMGGANPSSFVGDMRPVESVTWNDIRGGKWDDHDAAIIGQGIGGPFAEDSFAGRLSSRARMLFDLPTEEQWEYAARAGSSAALTSGQIMTNRQRCRHLDVLARYDANVEAVHGTVGSYKPNAWGLYDVHGNVAELTVGVKNYHRHILNYIRHPEYKCMRGGSWNDPAHLCRLASRQVSSTNYALNRVGFRIIARSE